MVYPGVGGGTETWREVVTCPMSHRGPCVSSSPNPGVTVAPHKACGVLKTRQTKRSWHKIHAVH